MAMFRVLLKNGLQALPTFCQQNRIEKSISHNRCNNKTRAIHLTVKSYLSMIMYNLVRERVYMSSSSCHLILNCY